MRPSFFVTIDMNLPRVLWNIVIWHSDTFSVNFFSRLLASLNLGQVKLEASLVQEFFSSKTHFSLGRCHLSNFIASEEDVGDKIVTQTRVQCSPPHHVHDSIHAIHKIFVFYFHLTFLFSEQRRLVQSLENVNMRDPSHSRSSSMYTSSYA